MIVNNDRYGTRLEDKLTGKTYLKAIMDPSVLDTHYVFSANKDRNKREKFKWTPMDDEWKESCKNLWWYGDNKVTSAFDKERIDERIYDLRSKLLSFGGEAACLPIIEEDLTDILKNGQFWFGSGAKLMKGSPSHCHANSCELYSLNKDTNDIRICTGYALSGDGMWRQHSWLVLHKSRSNQIIETTCPRIGYFGFVMSPEQCDEFCYMNL